MEDKEINFPLKVYDDHLSVISNIKFTNREIDIITLIVHMRGTSKIACLLSISTRTVETHTANIMRKMDTNSREGIIDFIQKSEKCPAIQKNYQHLLIENDFKKHLKEISTLLRNQTFNCSIIYDSQQTTVEPLLYELKSHLELSGLTVSLVEHPTNKPIFDYIQQNGASPKTHFLYVAHKKTIDQLQLNKRKRKTETSHKSEESSQNDSVLTILLFDKTDLKIPTDVLDVGCIPYNEQEGYYLFVLDILQKILPNLNLGKIISDFKNKQKSHSEHFESIFSSKLMEKKLANKNQSLYKKRNILAVSALAVVGSVYFGSPLLNLIPRNQNGMGNIPSIRCDIVVPTANTFLNRAHIMAKIEHGLQGNDGIQSVALVGIGGSGKTTIARKYALQKSASVVWEINAATREGLRNSFELLADALCKSEDEKNLLHGLREIKNQGEKEEKIIIFVKERLKSCSDWFLIYDNVEKFTNLQKYLPCDPNVWGKGKIIITSRDSNIKNNSHINSLIEIGELNLDEKLSLFIKIMNNEEHPFLTPFQKEEASLFLNKIPPFPLDVSIAAYYLKSTHIPYEKYLEHLREYNKDFENIQENVVREASDYTATRYSIITLSLKQLIDTHDDFEGLLLLISLLDSQNIPRVLLDNYKNDIVVDNFIYNLKKYSLVTSESSSNTFSTFSIHRNTQEIILAYLTKTRDLSPNNQLLHSIASTLENYTVTAIDQEDFSTMQLLVTHCKTFLNHENLFNNKVRSSIGGALGCIYYYLRNNLKARQLLEENLINLNLYYRESADKIARTLVYLGNFYRDVGDYEKAKTLLEESLVICKKNPDNYARTARALGYLGVIYRDLGNYKTAKQLLEQSLAIHEKHSKNNTGHGWILAHLGNIYRIFGDYQKAKIFLEQSLAIYKKQSEDHIGASWVLGYLGEVYRALGDYEKAQTSLEQNLLITRKYFSDDHVYIASGFSYLGSVYTEKGDYQKAKAILQQTLKVYEKNYGKNHIEIARVLRRLGEAHLLEGDMETAEDLINQSLLVFQQKKYPEAYQSLESYAELYLQKTKNAAREGDTKRAQKFKNQSTYYLKQALTITKEYFSEDSPHSLRIQFKLDSLQQENLSSP